MYAYIKMLFVGLQLFRRSIYKFDPPFMGNFQLLISVKAKRNHLWCDTFN